MSELTTKDMDTLLAMTPDRLADLLGGVVGALKCKAGAEITEKALLKLALSMKAAPGETDGRA